MGIDIGTSSVKIVELASDGRRLFLSNYGQVDLGLIEEDGDESEKNGLKKALSPLSVDNNVEIIQTLLSEMKVKSRQCAFSIPDFSTFFTAFSLPQMTEKELADAVLFEARQHIPLPIESVTVDWQLVEGEIGKSEKLDLTVAAVLNEIISQYKEIASRTKLQVVLMEAEAFGLVESLVPQDEARPLCIVDIGAQSTVTNVVEKRVLRYSHGFDRGSNYLISELGRRFPESRGRLRDAENKLGFKFIGLLDQEVRQKIDAILREEFLPIFRELEMVLSEYRRSSGKEIEKIIISGGVAAISGVEKYFAEYFKKEIEIADPFKEFDLSDQVSHDIKDIGPAFAVAAGMARRGFEILKRQNKN